LPTLKIPCGEERLAETNPSASSRNARKLLVPQSTAINAFAPTRHFFPDRMEPFCQMRPRAGPKRAIWPLILKAQMIELPT
jgi:hypothetical protein